jgi:hypothetical protein
MAANFGTKIRRLPETISDNTSLSPNLAVRIEKLILAIFTLYLPRYALWPYSPNWYFFSFLDRQIREGDFRATMVAVGNHSYWLGNRTLNETKRTDILHGVWAMFDALGLA